MRSVPLEPGGVQAEAGGQQYGIAPAAHACGRQATG